MRTNFNRLSKPELEFIKDNCCFSTEEIKLLEMAASEKSDTEISLELNISIDSVTRKKKKIKCKIINFLEVSEYMTILYLNGNRVSADELKNHEIKIKEVKKILLKKLTGGK